MNARTKRALEALENPNVKVMLDLIAQAEGVEHGYHTMFGNTQLQDLTDHPRKLKEFTQTDGKKNKTSAAGRYQFVQDTWDDVAKKLDLKDFGPRNQDLAAIELIRRAGALEDVEQGNFEGAVKRLGKTWASLPSSPYPQKKRSDDWVQSRLAQITGDDPLPQALAQATPEGEPTPVSEDAPISDRIPSHLMPDWASEIAAIAPDVGFLSQQAPDAVEPDAYDRLLEELLDLAIADDARDARNAAVAAFFGQDAMPEIEIPKSIERTINRLLAENS